MAKPGACPGQEDGVRQVTLSMQRLRVLPPAVLGDPALESLDLDRNKLRSIAGISKLCNLKKLILSKNEIVDFPDEIQSLVRLEKLELNQNQIRVIPEGVFCHLPRLKHLRLNNNRLSALPRDLAACRGSLQYLNISNNLFRTFPQPVLQLACLQELHVQNNALRQLPRELFQGQSLKMVKASGNPLREPPSEVCAGGIQQIQNYFSQLQHSSGQEDKRVKTMFLGASLAGKSTICQSLKQGQTKLVPKEERTVGIEISEFQIEDFTFLFWDFAGQLEYYMTHHVFITPQALVILVINLHMYQITDQSFKELVGFWINNLFMRVPNSVVLPVGTHVDCCREEEVEEKRRDIMAKIAAMLVERKSNLAHFIDNLEGSEEPKFYVDQWERLKEMESHTLTILHLVAVNCTDHSDIKKLEATILEHVKKEELFPEVVRVLPPVYRQVEAAIVAIAQSEEMAGHGMMDFQYLLSKLSQRESLASLGRELLQDILRYLHRIGLLVWYEEIKHLESTVFLQPTFLITMFKLLVRYRLVQQLESISVDTLIGEHATIRDRSNWVWTFKSKAMLCHRAVRALVKHQLFSEGMQDVFEEIMGHGPHRGRGKLFSLLKHFELCLETQEVSEVWGGDHPEDLHIRAYFSPEIPEGFFQRFLVKACSFYSTHWVAKVTCLLVCNGKALLIKENNQRAYSYLELRCRKPAGRTGFQFAWDFLVAAVFIVQKLAEAWPGLHVCVKTPCRTAGCPAELIWPDMDGTNTTTKEDVKTCGTCGHRFGAELLLPKVPRPPEQPPAQPSAHYYVTSYGTTTFGSSSIQVNQQVRRLPPPWGRPQGPMLVAKLVLSPRF
ncbi:malignant fibrous histiocytoma-amplified sequence 1 homolog isoform X4 [Falco biarmicus]|uniref:malignant fibrous histiocytoma-amplified sequence 1 homolog isoform X5 n=1 Tax=Falco peregrinus TaxID=8954 RepID=UPI00247ACF5E|nr:malignant fibrous histiocytoma-amplified sequence 1 homolog isoform X5 [Falco peregrinus]XP_056210135.1 malignant fibrous histiocytoma-amplified sequence 1 homolog isoform X4 [Falco biarmicus]